MTTDIIHRFTWQEIAPGRWERDTDEVEQFYSTLARRFMGTGRTFFAMTAHASLTVAEHDESVESRVIYALQKAWIWLRYNHPTIASWVEYDNYRKKCKKIYEEFPRDNEDYYQGAWLRETFRIVCNDQSGEEWCNSDPPVPKLPTLFLIKQKKGSDEKFTVDIVLRSQHDIIDGIGSLHLLNNLLQYGARAYENPENYSVPAFGDEGKNLSPPLRVAASIPETLSPASELRFNQIVDNNTFLRKDVEIATVPFRYGSAIPGRHQRVALTLTHEETTQVLEACKNIKASVTHVYHAAIAIVLRDIQERRAQPRIVRYISYSLINERANCNEPYSTPQHAVAVYHSVSGQSMAIDLTVSGISGKQPTEDDAREEMMRVIQEVKDYYLAIRRDGNHLSMVPSYWRLSTPEYPAGKETPSVPAPNPTPSASISSLGIIDNIISPTQGPFEVDNPWVAGEELGTGLGLFLGTFRGRMCLSAVYNDAWHEKSEVLDFVERCNALVMAMWNDSAHRS